MKLFALVLLAGFTYSAKLDNTYLPPVSAKSASGAQFLNTPFNTQPSNFNEKALNFNEQPSNFNGHSPNYNEQSTNFNGQPLNQYASNNIQTRKQAFQKPSNYNYPLSSYVTPNHQIPSRPSPNSLVYTDNFRSNNPEARANTIRADNTNDGSGNYHFNYETENKISQNEHGQLKQVSDGEASVVQGSYSYPGDDGKLYTVNYIADENGFQPTGEHIDQAISSVALDAAKSAAADGQRGYSYNIPQDSNSQEYYQGYPTQQPQVFRNYQGGFNNKQPFNRGNQQGLNGQRLVAGQYRGIESTPEGLSSYQPSFNGQQVYTQQDANNGGYKY